MKKIINKPHSGFTLLVVSVTLLECGVIFRNFFDFQIAYTLFFSLGNYLLLVIVVWGLNTILVGRLNSSRSAIKAITLVVTGFMGLLTAALIGLSCFIAWRNTEAGRDTLVTNDQFEKYLDVLLSYQKYVLAYWVLYLLSVIAAGGLAISTLIRMRSRNILVGVGFQGFSYLNGANSILGHLPLDGRTLCLYATLGGLPDDSFRRQYTRSFGYYTSHIRRDSVFERFLLIVLIHLSYIY